MWFYVSREVSNIKVKIKTCFASDFEIVKSIIDIFKTTPKIILIIHIINFHGIKVLCLKV